MSVHYKFKSSLDCDTITFDGLHISVADLKRAIVHQKRLGKITDFDLQIINAQTKEEYNDDSSLIPKNTSLIIARVPLVHQPKKMWEVHNDKQPLTKTIFKGDETAVDISRMNGSEEDKIQAMMLQSVAEYDPKSYQKLRGQSQTGDVPSTYRCNKCKKGGHWIKSCPFVMGKEHMDVKRNTGIPRSFRDKDDNVLKLDLEVPVYSANKQNIPEDLLCNLCNDLFTDAVMIPCCGSSFCDDCVRTALIESEENECPDCKEKGSSPGSLIPNRFLRNSVNAYKNATGYKNLDKKKDEILPKIQRVAAELHLDESRDKIVENNSKEIEKQKNCEEIKQKSDNKLNPEITQCAIVKTHLDSPNQKETESDFEDNIIVTMPTSLVGSQNVMFREQILNCRNQRPPKPPGIGNSPRNIRQVSPIRSRFEGRSSEWERPYDYQDFDKDIHAIVHRPQTHTMSPFSSCQHQEMTVRPLNSHDLYPPPGPRMNNYQQMPSSQIAPRPPIQGSGIGTFNIYNQMVSRPVMGFPHFPRPVFQQDRSTAFPSINGMVDGSCHSLPSENLVSVYENVAAKVGTGFIDDPLEAFNRIMREKEQRKVKRRLALEHHRSRSKDRQQRNRFRQSSPYNQQHDKESPKWNKRRRSRDKFRRRAPIDEKKIEKTKSSRHNYQDSFSDRSSRSRSRSNSSLRKELRSPNYIRNSSAKCNMYEDKKRNFVSDKNEVYRLEAAITRKSNRKQQKWFPPHPTISKDKRLIQGIHVADHGDKGVPENPSDCLQYGEGSHFVPLEPPPPGFEPPEPIYGNKLEILRDDKNKFVRSTTPEISSFVSEDLNECKIDKSNYRSAKKYLDTIPNTFLNPSLESLGFKTGLSEEANQPIFRRGDKTYKAEAFQEKHHKKHHIFEQKEGKEKNQNLDEENEKQIEDVLKVVQNDSVKGQQIDKSEKRSRERKKKRKDKTERKKFKKDKKDKRDRSKQISSGLEYNKMEDMDGNLYKQEQMNELEMMKAEKQPMHSKNEDQAKIKLPFDQNVSSNKDCINHHKNSEPNSMLVNDVNDFQNLDAVLEIHEFETDFGETNKNSTTDPEMLQWDSDKKDNNNIRNSEIPELIFARKINAGYHTEDNTKSLQITVRASEAGNECQKRSHSPKTKSIKDRLGSKIVHENPFTDDKGKTNNQHNRGRWSSDRNTYQNSWKSGHFTYLETHDKNRRSELVRKNIENNFEDNIENDHFRRTSNNFKDDKIFHTHRISSRDSEKKSVESPKEPKNMKIFEPDRIRLIRNVVSSLNRNRKSSHNEALKTREDKDVHVHQSSEYSDSNSESDSSDFKRKKPHKKKIKKRSKRSSSIESITSVKKKHMKSKKRSKSSKKKKKSKK